MKNYKYIFALLVVYCITSCEKKDLNWNLPRDNPLDTGSTNNNSTKVPILNYSKYSVYNDDNGDGIINKGETIKLKVYVKNNGTSTANGVKGTITTSNSYISNLLPTTNVDYNSYTSGNDIPAGQERYGYYAFAYTVQFTVSNTTPIGSNIIFNMNITDDFGNNWADSFTITVQ